MIIGNVKRVSKWLRNIRLLPFGSAFCDSTTIYNKASWQELTSTILSEATELEVAKVRFLSKLPFFAFIGSWRWRSDRVYNSATAIHDRTCDIINSVDLLPLRRWNELLDLLVQPLKSRFNMAYYRDITSPERRQSWYRPKQSNHVKLFVMWPFLLAFMLVPPAYTVLWRIFIVDDLYDCWLGVA